MKTALNALWDAGAGPDDRIAVIGADLIGCLVARLAARMPGAEVTMSDPIRRRAEIATELSANFTSDPREGENFDIAIHASATAEGLAAAIGRLDEEGRLAELSWYGAGEVGVPLGAAFHSRRLSILSSEVGAVSPTRRPRWPHRRRLLKALALLDDPALDVLIDTEVAFEELPARLPALLARDAPGVATVIRYE